MAQPVKNLPTMQEMKEIWVQSLGQEDSLEEGMVTHSSILDWRILWTEEVGGLWYIVLQRVGHATHTGCHWASLVALVVKNLFASAGLGSSPGVGNDMYRCESWTIKNAEYQKIEAFELWCWRTLESPLDCKKIKSVSPKGNQP